MSNEAKHVYFVRHGESEGNVKQVGQHAEEPLSPTGERQAVYVAGRLSSLPIEVTFASPMKRAADTAKMVSEALHKEVISSELFQEARFPSVVIGQHKNSDIFSSTMQAMLANFGVDGWRHSDEENYDDLFDRATRALKLLEERPEKHIAVVTHGGFLKMLISVMMTEGKPNPSLFPYLRRVFLINNTGVTVCRFDPKNPDYPAWRLLTWNDYAHLAEA